MINSFEQKLSGGHHNSLGNTEEVVAEVLQNPHLFDNLFACYQSPDELVRLRVSSALKRIAKAKKELVLPYLSKIITEIAAIDQASTQWTIAQIFLLLEKDLSSDQRTMAINHFKHNLEMHKDWIVLNTTMETLFEWSKESVDLKKWLIPQLKKLSNDSRKSVAKRANKYLLVLKTE